MNKDLNTNNAETDNESLPPKQKMIINIVFLIILALVINAMMNNYHKNYNPKKASKTSKSLTKSTYSPRGAEDIPNAIYENTLRDDKLANVLLADKKVIYFAYLETCPISNRFRNNLESLMRQNSNLRHNYYYYPHPQPRSMVVYCKKRGTTQCAQNYLLQNCSNNACIVNPKTRQILQISNKKASQAYDAIEKNMNW